MDPMPSGPEAIFRPLRGATRGIGLVDETTPPPSPTSDPQAGATLESDTSPDYNRAGDGLGQLGAAVLQEVQNLESHVEGFLNKPAPSCLKDTSASDDTWADAASEVAPKCPNGATSDAGETRSAKMRARQKQWPIDPSSAHQQRIQTLLECLPEHTSVAGVRGGSPLLSVCI